MSAPRLTIDLDKLEFNARSLVDRLKARGIRVTAVTKASLGSPDVARALLRAGVSGLGDSRIENVARMREAGITTPISLLRSPMKSQAGRVVQLADLSLNSELDIIAELSAAATAEQRVHRVVLMVELGDLREGIMPRDLVRAARETLRFPNIQLAGIGTNLACRSGVVPDERNMAELSALADSVEAALGLRLEIVSGGNSANLSWALDASDAGRINDLRLGESILLGCEPLHRRRLDGLHDDAVTLVAEVIEAKRKPSLPWGEIAQTAFGEEAPTTDRGEVAQVILAIGRQDVDPHGLHLPPGMDLLGASSDHLVIDPGSARLPVGSEVKFQLNYSALVRAMTSPFVEKVMLSQGGSQPITEERMDERAVAATPSKTG